MITTSIFYISIKQHLLSIKNVEFLSNKNRKQKPKEKKNKIKERIVDVTTHIMLLLLLFHKTHATPPPKYEWQNEL